MVETRDLWFAPHERKKKCSILALNIKKLFTPSPKKAQLSNTILEIKIVHHKLL